ncbi:MAG: MMPL family transporter [Candidatus Sericytochromatia bacterium]
MQILLEHLSRFLYQKRVYILFVWLFALVLAGLNLKFNPHENPEVDLSGARDTEAYEVVKLMREEFGLRLGSTAAVVLPQQAPVEALIPALQKRFPQLLPIRNLDSNRSHQFKLLLLEFDSRLRMPEAQALSGPIRAFLKRWSEQTGFKTWLTGNTAFQYDAHQEGNKDSHRGESIALLISFVILILNFGALTSALLPLLMGASTLILLNSLLKLPGFGSNPVSRILTGLVGLALAIDYSLFLVSRFREECKQGKSAEQALAITLKWAGETVLFSALIMFCSIAVLLIPDVSLSRTVMQGILMVIGLSLVNSLLVLPALLALGERFLDRPRFLSRWIGRFDSYPSWKRFSEHVTGHPMRYFLLSAGLLLLCALPVSWMKLWEPVQAVAPRQSESMLGYQQLQKDGWAGELLPVTLVVKAPPGQTVFEPALLEKMAAFYQVLRQEPYVAEVKSLVSWNPDFETNDYLNLYNNLGALGLLNNEPRIAALVNISQAQNLSLMHILPSDPMELEDTRKIIRFTRAYAAQHPEITLLTGGVVARVQDFTHELYRHAPLMLALVFGGIYGLLFAIMRTVILPLKAAIMNFLPIVSAFGLLTLVFQQGWFSELLHTPVNGAVTNIVPLVLFCIIFGLSMDYEVLILSRISEYYHRGAPVREAVVEGLARSGSVITGAVLILLGVFLPGVFSGSPQTQEICIGISAAILLDATVVRLFLVPSFMMLLGRWNWWRPGYNKAEAEKRRDKHT